MKFINLGDKHAEYDFFEDTAIHPDEGKPRRTPSYIDTAKKHSSIHASMNSRQKGTN